MGHIKTLIAAVFTLLLATAAVAQSEYRVRAGDTLAIEVLQDPGLNRSAVVLSDGRISFPFAGTVRVGGRTVTQIETAIAEAIAPNFAAPPNVFVSVVPAERLPSTNGSADAPTIDIYFLGEVNTPGLVEMEPGTRLLQAIAQSGGLTRFAADKRLQLRRTDKSTGTTDLFVINLRAILDGGAVTNNLVMRDGDVIIVPERRLFE